jgi:Tol biopolymer transport system component
MNGPMNGMRQDTRGRLMIVILAAGLLWGCDSGEKPHMMGETGSASGSGEPADPIAGGPALAFNSDRDGDSEVYLTALEGGEAINLTENEATDWVYYAGERIVFASDRDGDYRQGDYDLYSTDRRGVMTVKLTRFPVYDSYLSASPDGERYVVSSRKDGSSEIYIIDKDGNEETRLTHDEFENRDPCWSPGGFRIAFRSNRGGAWDIWLMNVDGSNLRQLTKFPGNDDLHGYQEGPPHWSPDGKLILFSSERGGNFDLYLVQADGWALHNLTNSPSNEVWASWSPDGKQIAFDTDRDGNHEIYVMNVDGTGLRRITDHPAADQGPVWVGP